jgi:hypothetical protein
MMHQAWELVNFSIIGGVAVICRPSDNSGMLSYASQLPTEDPGKHCYNYYNYCCYCCCFLLKPRQHPLSPLVSSPLSSINITMHVSQMKTSTMWMREAWR